MGEKIPSPTTAARLARELDHRQTDMTFRTAIGAWIDEFSSYETWTGWRKWFVRFTFFLASLVTTLAFVIDVLADDKYGHFCLVVFAMVGYCFIEIGLVALITVTRKIEKFYE